MVICIIPSHSRPIAEIFKQLKRYRRPSHLIQAYQGKFQNMWNAQKIGRARPFWLPICFLVLCNITPNFRPKADILKSLQRKRRSSRTDRHRGRRTDGRMERRQCPAATGVKIHSKMSFVSLFWIQWNECGYQCLLHVKIKVWSLRINVTIHMRGCSTFWL